MNRVWKVMMVQFVALMLFVPSFAQTQSEPVYGVVEELDVKVPMRDGVLLSTNIYRPDAEGQFPVIVQRTPYGNGDAGHKGAHFWAARGYVAVLQDVRGRFESEGEFLPFSQEGQDGFDTFEWLGQQSWCNGRIGTSGGSYVGITQWMPAPLGSSYVKAMFPVVASGNCYDSTYPGGAFQLSLLVGWSTAVTQQAGEKVNEYPWGELFKRLPLATWDTGIGREIPHLRKWLSHSTEDAYWAPAVIDGQYGKVEALAFNVGGWYDIFSTATVKNYVQMVQHGKTDAIRNGQRLVMGPWAHGMSKDGSVGDLAFGKHSLMNLRDLELRWFDYALKGMDNGIADEAPIKIFVMGANVWRDESEWPLARTNYTRMYLHSQGQANTLSGDGALTFDTPHNQAPDRFTYDPTDPVPTAGGNNLFGVPIGPYDQREVEKRTDVLVYSSPVLEEAVEVTGPIKMVLYASTNVTDTDFTAKLVDVHPMGYAQNLADGIMRARYRESKKSPSLIEPGKVYAYEIDLGVTSNVFHAGHRIRVEISSSNFPRFDRNPNTGHSFGVDDELMSAEQTVYHDAERASYILLPMIE